MKRWLPVIIALALIASLVGWRLNQKRKETAAQAGQQKARSGAAATVQAAVATRRDIVQTFDTVGSVESPSVVSLTPQITGKLLYLAVHEGDAVHAGEVLARIDTAEVEANVHNKEAAVAEAEQRLAQAQVTQSATSVGVTTDIQKQQATLTSTRATLNQALADEQAQIGTAEQAIRQAQGTIESANAAIGTANAAIHTAQANLDNANTNLKRQQELYNQGATAKVNLDNAQTLVEVAQAALEQAQQQKANAQASLQSAQAAKASAQNQESIVRHKAITDIAAAKAGVGQAVASLTASRANTANIAAYQKNLNALNAAVAAAQADLRTAEAQRSYATIVAPMDAVVTQRNIDPGSIASPGAPLLTLQAIKQVWVSAGVPEEISRHIYEGQTATCTFDALPGQSFHGRVIQINSAADPQSRQFQARIRLDNPQYRIKPGMFGQVQIETERERNVIAVPSEAVRYGSGDRSADASITGQEATVVVVGPDNKAEIRKVKTGASDSQFISITDGLQEGEKVVTLSARNVRDGQALKLGNGKARGSGAGNSADAGGSSDSTGGGGGSGGQHRQQSGDAPGSVASADNNSTAAQGSGDTSALAAPATADAPAASAAAAAPAEGGQSR